MGFRASNQIVNKGIYLLKMKKDVVKTAKELTVN